MLRPLYALFGALAAASLTACLPLGEMYLIEQTPLVRWMASDPEYGYETYCGSVGGNSNSLLPCGAGPCADVSGLLAAVALAGFTATAGCATAVFRLGGSDWTNFAQFGASGYIVDTDPKYGGGGTGPGFGGGGVSGFSAFVAVPSGAVVLYFT